MPADDDLRAEIAAAAARLVAEEGCEYGPAKRRAVHELLGDSRAAPVPDNAEVEREVRRYLRLFEADTHPKRLAALRRVAASLMERFALYEPHLTGAVLNGTATEHSDIHLHLYVDSAKDVEVCLLDAGVEFDVDEGPPDERPRMLERLAFVVPAPRDIGLPRQMDRVAVHLHVYPRDAIRVAPRHRPDAGLEPDLHPVEASGRAGLAALRRLIEDTSQ
ncbi:MAG: hypothetical protein ACM3O5_08645 [Betaproteobacteria bacterium]